MVRAELHMQLLSNMPRMQEKRTKKTSRFELNKEFE